MVDRRMDGETWIDDVIGRLCIILNILFIFLYYIYILYFQGLRRTFV